jgi:acetoin utilization deacetylase AcuC-like enzyme
MTISIISHPDCVLHQAGTGHPESCAGRMVSVLEGGYNLDVLAECVPVHVNAMVV